MKLSCTVCGSDRVPCDCGTFPVVGRFVVDDTADPVNHPSHYKLFPDQEAIDIIKASLTEEEFKGYCKGNALKYRLRAGEKGDTQQDIDKSNWYRDRLRESGATQS